MCFKRGVHAVSFYHLFRFNPPLPLTSHPWSLILVTCPLYRYPPYCKCRRSGRVFTNIWNWPQWETWPRCFSPTLVGLGSSPTQVPWPSVSMPNCTTTWLAKRGRTTALESSSWTTQQPPLFKWLLTSTEAWQHGLQHIQDLNATLRWPMKYIRKFWFSCIFVWVHVI